MGPQNDLNREIASNPFYTQRADRYCLRNRQIDSEHMILIIASWDCLVNTARGSACTRNVGVVLLRMSAIRFRENVGSENKVFSKTFQVYLFNSKIRVSIGILSNNKYKK